MMATFGETRAGAAAETVPTGPKAISVNSVTRMAAEARFTDKLIRSPLDLETYSCLRDRTIRDARYPPVT
jgi:hypothetical protein